MSSEETGAASDNPPYAALGRMVSVVRVLENGAYDVARALGVLDPEMRQLSGVLGEAHRQAREGLPPWTRALTVKDVESWVHEVDGILKDRNRYVHWRSLKRAESGGMVGYQRSLRDGREQAESVADLQALTARATSSMNDTSRLLPELLFQIRPGVYHPHPSLARPGEEWSPLVYFTGGKWPDRPTETELDSWFRDLTQASPFEWADWPRARYETQALERRRRRQN